MPLKIFKRGSSYHVRGTIAGQRIRESTGCGRRADAEVWAHRRETELRERHALGVEATLTLAEAALTYLQAGGEGRFVTPILDHFGQDYRLVNLDNAAVNDAALALYPTAAPATVNRQLITPLRAICSMAAEDGLTHHRKFRMRKGENRRTRWLRPAEVEALLANAGPALRPVIACLVGTGARVNELLQAQVASFTPETGEIWLDETKNDFPRMVKMPARARDALLAAGLPKAGALIRKGDGKAYAVKPRQVPFKTAFNGARDRAKLGPEVTPHVMRHTWATWYYAQTRDFGGLLDLGGWRVSDMAQRYRKIAPDNLAEELLAHGWDFTALGRSLPGSLQGSARLRAANQRNGTDVRPKTLSENIE